MAKVKKPLNSLESIIVANDAVKKMFKRKTVIVPDFKTRLGINASKLLPIKLKTKLSYHIQSAKC